MPSRREAEKGQRLAEAQSILEEREDGALVGRLLADITRRGQAEDVVAYTPAELARIAADAWEALAMRVPGKPRIRIFNPDFGDAGRRHQAVTVIEVLNDDMPFLLDSIMGELTESGLTIHLVLHPILALDRDARGTLAHYNGLAAGRGGDREARESFVHVHVGRIGSEAERVALGSRLEETLADVRAAVTDWKAMLAALGEAIESYRRDPPPFSVDEGAEAIQFLQWLGDDNFTFLGIRDYVLEGEGDEAQLVRSPAPALGVLRDPSRRVLRRGNELLTSTPEIRDALLAPRPLVITKANIKSRVHRRVHMDYVGIKRYAEGRLAGELRILGLFTSTAYTRSTRTIPYVRRKVDHVISRAGLDPRSHSGKSLFNVLESLPRDELLQIDEDTLFDWAMQVLALDEHPRVRVLMREDIFRRHVSALVYVPRDRYSTDARIRIGNELERAFGGHVAAYFPAFPEGALARVHFIVARPDISAPMPAQDVLEAAVNNVVRSWADGLEDALLASMEPMRAGLTRDRYGRAFSAAYQDHFSPEDAVPDIRAMERLAEDRPLTIDFVRREGEVETRVALKLFHQESPISLSERIPVLENMGFRVINERTYRIAPAGGRVVFMHEMVLERADAAAIDLAHLDQGLEALFLAVWSGAAENDGFNALGLKAGLAWRDIAIVRAFSRYLRQVGIAYSQDYIWTTLVNHTDVVARLIDLFRTRFDPDAVQADRKAAAAEIGTDIGGMLDKVSSLDEDRILRRFVNLIDACVRTNAFQVEDDGEARRVLAFKFDSKRVDEMPEPKPFREIWVYAPRVEGVHLRFGKVARGGLRWSDRPQDFRTEVLGLVKAQQVKNAVIVPVGAKGGFVPKWLKPGMSRDESFAEGTEAYKTFVRTLLTITDNLDGETVQPPPRVVRYEGDDPYLVVAADKGTATFSDTANGIAVEAGYWLGDAFASGGSAGYDHKKMGITARGAFEAVKRHFREMDIDIMTTEFSVVGVGDMSGDVFGNGMLLAPTIRLLAAFDHRDIFIDPSPDPAKSLAERQRLFDKPRSSWQDYDRKLISAGGGVFSRALKSIELSAEAREALGIKTERATPQDVMRAILKAPADLLWFGGIGTYVRADEETDAEVGDKANDALRVTADELRVKVIGEGANLGMTQQARIAFAMNGGRCNSDAIDNSAGVNSSDMEVNIKIALANAVRAGKLDLAARNKLLASMTEEVAGLVLANNYSQTLAISLTERRGMEDFGYQRRLMQSLEARGLLNRAVEDLPEDAVLTAREKAGRPLTRPEIGVLLAYAKLALKDELLTSAAPDDPVLAAELLAYFPSAMRTTYADAIAAHRLRREIITTRLVNAMIDRGGPTLVVRASDQTGVAAPDIALAFAAARDIYALGALDDEIDALDARIAGTAQLELYGKVQELLLGAIIWLVRNVTLGDGLQPVVDRFRDAAAAIVPKLPDLLPAELSAPAKAEAAALVAKGLPETLAHRLGYLVYEAEVPDVVLVAERGGTSLDEAARVYFEVAHRFRIRRLEEKARTVAVGDYFDGLALDRARGILADAHRRIAADAMGNGGVDGWVKEHGRAVDRTLATVAEITSSEALSVSRLAVAAGLLADLARAA